MRRVKTNGEHNKKGSPEVNGVRSLTRSMIWGLGTLLELQEVPELTWYYNRNRVPTQYQVVQHISWSQICWRDDEPILASIGFSSTFQLQPQLIYQIFDFIACYPQPPSSIFHQTCHTVNWCNHPALLLPCNYWHHNGCLMQMIIASIPKITTDFILLLMPNYPISNPLSDGLKSLLL